MTPRAVAANLAALMALLALFLIAPFGLAVFQGLPRSALAYGFTAAVAGGVAAVLHLYGRGHGIELHRKDAIATVVFMWLGLGLIGALPFLIEGAIHKPAAAIFEAVSGFTTTGATVVSDVDGLSDPTNLWRCMMHWIGGMGIVVLFVAIFPQLGVTAKQLFKSEAAGPVKEGLRPRIKQTAFALWAIYTGFTAANALALWALGMSPFDAICHAFSTLGTGGYSTRSASVGAWASPAIHWVTSLFMLIAALNFGLFYDALRGHWRDVLQNSELRFYLGVNAVVVAVVFFSIMPLHTGPLEALRYAVFQVLAVTTTTGFMTEDFETYPEAARMCLFLCMFMGGCAGSTAGGMKAIRILVLIKMAWRELQGVLEPQVVLPVRVGRQVYDMKVLQGILVFSTTFLLLWAAASLFLVFEGEDLLTAMSASIACLASIGPGLNEVGPTQNFAHISAGGQLMLSLCMIAGRLELFALFAVLSPELWRRG